MIYMDLKAIGKFIKKLREEKGLSQNQLSEIVHVTRQAVSTWEVGRSLPDSSILLELSKLFDVSINELLQGEKNYNNSSKSQKLENVTLSLVDSYNSKIKKLLTVIKISLIITLLLLFILSCSYFFMYYNSIKIYRIYGTSDNFFTNDGLLIKTRKEMYLRLGKIQKEHINKKIKINKIKLYYVTQKGIKKVLYYDEKDNIILIENNNYDEIPYKELKYLTEKNKLYLEITFNDNKKEIVKLKLKKKFSNSFKPYENKRIISKKYITNNNNIRLKNIAKKIEEKGEPENKGYTYVVKEEDSEIKFYYANDVIAILKEKNGIIEIWRILIIDKSIVYEKINNNEVNHIEIDTKNINKKDNSIYKEAINYLKKYILS